MAVFTDAVDVLARPVENYVWSVSSMTWVKETQPSGGGTGGAGDASAANQVLEIADLDAINAKLPALVGGRIPVDVPAGAAGLTDAELRAVPVPVDVPPVLIGGYIDGVTTIFGAPLPVDGSGFTQPVSGPLTDTELRASAVFVQSNTEKFVGGLNTFAVTVQGAPTALAVPVSGPLTDTQLRATAVPVSGSFFQATQPVSIASLPALAAGSALIGHVITDTGSTTAITGSVAVTGTFWQATQPVSGTFWQATQPVSAAALPLPAGASTLAEQQAQTSTLLNTEGYLANVSTNSNALANIEFRSGCIVDDVATTLISENSYGPGRMSTNKIPYFNLRNTTGTEVVTTTGTPGASDLGLVVRNVPTGTQAVSAASLPLPTGATTLAEQQSQTTALQLIDNIVSGTGANISQFGGTNVTTGTGAGGAGIPRVTVSNDSNVLVTPPTLTKGTQGTTGFAVQEYKDAGRVSVMITATVASTAATETLITLTRSIGLAATGTGTSLSITSGKKYRIQAIAISARKSTGVVASNVTVNLRAAVGGATTAASPLQMHFQAPVPASTVAVLFPPISIPDGFEIDSNAGTNTFGMTIIDPGWVTAAQIVTFDITMVGFEY